MALSLRDFADAGAWVVRARQLVPREDRKILLSPPRLVARFAGFAQHRVRGRAAEVPADDVHARDPELIELIVSLVRSVGARYFRAHFEGVENVPPSGPVLLVANHNGGLLPGDGFLTALALHDRFGPSRVPFVLAHDFLFEDPVLRRYAGRLGFLRAGHESARRALAEGACLLVYPGSDFDAFRSFRDRKRVVLGGRKGFIALALRAGVPIVPVVSSGTHEQLIVLTRGDRLARLLHAHTWARTEVLPIVLAIPWGVTIGFVPYVPLPAQTTVSFGPPLRWPELGPADAERPEVLERCYREVEARMQSMLDRLEDGRRVFLGKAGPRGASSSAEPAARPEGAPPAGRSGALER